MKFVASNGNEQQRPEYDKNALFKENAPVDLLKTENGFETLPNNTETSNVVEPQAEIITSADQLEQEPKKDIDIAEIFANMNQPEQGFEQSLPVQPEPETTPTPVQEPVKKNKKINPVFIIVILLLVVCGGYYAIFSSPRNLSNSIMEKTYEAYYRNVDLKNNIVKASSFSTYGTISLSTTIEEYKAYDGFLVDYVISADENTERLNTSLKVSNDKTTIYDILVYLDGKNSLVNYNGLFKDALNFDGTAYAKMLFKLIDTKDYKEVDYDYLLKVVTTSIGEGIPKEDMSRKLVFETIGSSKKLAYKVTIDLNSNSVTKTLSKVASSIKIDSKALKDLSVLLGKNEEDTIVYLDSFINAKVEKEEKYGEAEIYINPLNKEIYLAKVKYDENIIEIVCNGDENTINIKQGEGKSNAKFVYAVDRTYSNLEVNMENDGIVSAIKLEIKNYNLKDGYNNMDYMLTYYPDNSKITDVAAIVLKNHIKLNDGIKENEITKYEDVTKFNKEDREAFIAKISKTPSIVRSFLEEITGLSVPVEKEVTTEQTDLLENL